MRRRPSQPLWCVTAAAVALATVLGVAGVRLDWWRASPSRRRTPFEFRDGFENADTLADLLPRDGTRWHGVQCESAAWGGRNAVAVTSTQVYAGNRALKLVAGPYDGATASKADIVLGGLHVVKGDSLWFTGSYYLDGDAADVANLFLWDLETSRKAGSPGRRLYLQPGARLASDLGKWHSGRKFRQPWGAGVPFPTGRWVRLRVFLFLSNRRDGRMRVWQDDQLVLDAQGQTLPTAKTVYDRLQVGITANGCANHARTLYIDDIALSNRPLP